MKIELEHYQYTCEYGCCPLFGYNVFVDGEKIGSIDEDEPSMLVELLNEHFETKEI